MPSLYAFADSRFVDRIKFGRCAAENPGTYLKHVWCYTPTTVRIVAYWTGSAELVKAAEAQLAQGFVRDQASIDSRQPVGRSCSSRRKMRPGRSSPSSARLGFIWALAR